MSVYLSEFLGTMMMILLGDGVVAGDVDHQRPPEVPTRGHASNLTACSAR